MDIMMINIFFAVIRPLLFGNPSLTNNFEADRTTLNFHSRKTYLHWFINLQLVKNQN